MTSNTHGGARPGSGRKRKIPPATKAAPTGSDAEAYLAAVVAGIEPADPTRVRAALGLIRYQRTQQRMPLPSPPPLTLAAKAAREADAAVADAFEQRAAEIRARHAHRNNKEAQ